MTARRPLVSVLIPNGAAARHADDAVHCVLRQTVSDLEVVIVGGAVESQDGRVRRLKPRAEVDPRNQALAAARGAFVTFLDGDDLMSPDRLERLLARARVDRADLVVDNQALCRDCGRTPWRPLLSRGAWRHPRWISLADYIEAGRLSGAAPPLGRLKPLIRAELVAGEALRPELGAAAEYDLVLRLLAHGARMLFIPDDLYRRRVQPETIAQSLRREHIEQMLAADAALAFDAALECEAVRKAQRRRRRSLEAALAYEEVCTSWRARRLASAVGLCASHPNVWPILGDLRRLTRRGGAFA